MFKNLTIIVFFFLSIPITSNQASGIDDRIDQFTGGVCSFFKAMYEIDHYEQNTIQAKMGVCSAVCKTFGLVVKGLTLFGAAADATLALNSFGSLIFAPERRGIRNALPQLCIYGLATYLDLQTPTEFRCDSFVLSLLGLGIMTL